MCAVALEGADDAAKVAARGGGAAQAGGWDFRMLMIRLHMCIERSHNMCGMCIPH